MSLLSWNTNKRRELADSKYNERQKEREKEREELRRLGYPETLGELMNGLLMNTVAI